MAKVKSEEKNKQIRRAIDPQAREDQLISLAMNQAEKQLLEGTASSQVLTHFLKLGSMRAELELEKLAMEKELLQAKTESLQSMAHMDEVYADAIKAMKMYGGQRTEEDV